ncbi:MAG: EB domain-containing protein [Sandaracinaceae bacterium]
MLVPIVLALVGLLTACGSLESTELPRAIAFGETFDAPDPNDPPGATCVDVTPMHRVCFGDDGAPIGVHPRPSPSGVSVPPDGTLRCDGSRDARRCTLVRERELVCDTRECTQLAPRVPSDGEQECADVHGVVLCRGYGPPAGEVAGQDEPGWRCGTGERRVCVDLAPDLPDLESAYDCGFVHEPVFLRRCRPGPAARLGAVCTDDAACPEALLCVDGRCVPRALPRGECWTDPDCPEGRECVLSNCR